MKIAGRRVGSHRPCHSRTAILANVSDLPPVPPNPMRSGSAKRGITPVPQREGYVPARKPASASPVAQAASPVASPVARPTAPAKPTTPLKRAPNKWASRFLAFAILVVLGFAAVAALGSTVYSNLAVNVPDNEPAFNALLDARRSRFASTKVFDIEGNLLVELTDPNSITAGKRRYVPFEQMSTWVWQATTATEDPNFFRYNVGFDPIAILRVFYYVITEREFVSGGSTITQQVTRNLLLSPAERSERTAQRKIKEIVMANELARNTPRTKVLELYLNENNYGNLAYGIEAAAETYFGKSSRDLSMPEAAFLAGLPQSPAFWDPVQNEARALKRLRVVLGLMVDAGYINESEVEPAIRDIEQREFKPRAVNNTPVAPHFLNAVRAQLEDEYGSRLYEEPGLRVYTTLSPTLTTLVEQAIVSNIRKLRARNVTNGAAVVIDPRNGEVLAMVGSVDFYSTTIKGQVNVALSLRQPGSSIKPFTYLAAMEMGGSPATLYWDIPSTFVNKFGQAYTPRNYDGRFNGAVSMREALGRSLNIPAVKALDDVGLTRFFSVTQRAGIAFPANPAYGLAVTLGGAEARLLDMTGAYATLAAGGVYREPTLLRRVEDNFGKVLYDNVRDRTPVQAFAPEHAYLISHILSDDNARLKSFGPNGVLKLPNRTAAVKTGTTNDTRDNLAIGYTPELAVGVWAGNTDNSPMLGVSGIEGAAPIWRQVIEGALKGRPNIEFTRPPGVAEFEICKDGGHQPSPACAVDRRGRELFALSAPPLGPDEALERAVRGNDPALATQPIPPTAAPAAVATAAAGPDPAAKPAPAQDLLITTPPDGGLFDRRVFDIRGVINPSGFEKYQVEWGVGDTPSDWRWISGPHLSPVRGEALTRWSTEGLAPGRYTIRVMVWAGGQVTPVYSHFEVR